jgi:hypothetical protein
MIKLYKVIATQIERGYVVTLKNGWLCILFGIPARNCTILPNENVWLISCTKHKEQDAFIDLMNSEFKGLNIEIKYKSIYDEKFIESCKL